MIYIKKIIEDNNLFWISWIPKKEHFTSPKMSYDIKDWIITFTWWWDWTGQKSIIKVSDLIDLATLNNIS